MYRITSNLALSIFLMSLPFVAPTHTIAQERVDSPPSLMEVKHNVRGSGSNQYLREGDRLSVQLTAIGGIDVYAYVIYHDAAGDAILLFPNAKENNNFIAAEKHRQVPGYRSPTRGRMNYTISAPFGKERLQVIAAPKRLTELEQMFKESQPADVLNQYLSEISQDPEFDTQYSDFETRPAVGEPLQSQPELVQ